MSNPQYPGPGEGQHPQGDYGSGQNPPPPPPPGHQPPPSGQDAERYPPPGWDQQEPYTAYDEPPRPMRRPGSVTAAASITILLSVLTALGWVALIIGFTASRDEIEDEIRSRQDVMDAIESGGSDVDSVLDSIVGVGIGAAVICLLAVVFALISLRGANWARVITVIFAAATVIVGLVLVASLISLLWVVAGIAVIVLYFVGGANAWYRTKGGRR